MHKLMTAGCILAILNLAACVTHETARDPLDAAAPPDAGAIIAAALEAYETPNGPIIQVVSALLCPESCAEGAARAVLAAYAARINAELVAADGTVPPCRWNSEAPAVAARGLRLTVSEPASRDGTVSVTVGAICVGNTRFGGPTGFGEMTKFQAEHIDGAWRITRVLARAVT